MKEIFDTILNKILSHSYFKKKQTLYNTLPRV